MKYTDKAQDYFDRHPTSDECFITADGRVFHSKGAAEGFAGTLADNTIELYKRKVLEVQAASDQEKQLVAEKAEKTEMLKTLNIETADYNDVKALVKFFELPAADQKAETLKAALAEYQKALIPA